MWTNEEGSRFVPVMMGSGVFAGAFTLDHALAQCDRDGVSCATRWPRSAMRAMRTTARRASGRRVFRSAYRAGLVLEAHDTTIGVVEGALGQRWYDVTVHGMEARADADGAAA